MWTTLTSIALFISIACANYDGYDILIIQTEQIYSQSKASELVKFIDSAEDEAYDFWISPRVGTYAKIMSAPKQLPTLEKFLNDQSIAFSVLIEDVQA
ncbi:Carboxypeptidase B, partial [Caligus rogercresseyi]